MQEVISGDELIQKIVDVLIGVSNEHLAELANSLISANVMYIGDSLFQLDNID